MRPAVHPPGVAPRTQRDAGRTILRGFFAVALTGFFATTCLGAGYIFTNIADTTGVFSDFNAPSINASGKVAFTGFLDAGGSGIYTGNVGGITPIALSSGAIFSSFGSGSTPINAAGVVAFIGFPDAGGSGIFKSDGVTTVTIALSGAGGFAALSTAVSMNAAGRVAFQAQSAAGVFGIFAGSGGGTSPLYLSTDPMFSNFAIPVSSNDSGVVAFNANLDAGGTGIFVGDGGPPASIALSSGPFGNFTGNQLAINAGGTVAFVGSLDSGGNGVFKGNGGSTTTIAVSTSPFFASFNFPSINTAGTVVFLTGLDSGVMALYAGGDPVADKIIRVGDPLFGSTVTILRFTTSGLNDASQVAFFYALTDGRRGIAVATPGCQIVAITQLSNDTIHLDIEGVPNLTYSIQASPDLIQPFVVLGTVTAAADGTFHFDDVDAPTFTQRFYRVSLP